MTGGVDIIAVAKSQAGEGIAGWVPRSICVAVRSRRCGVVRKGHEAARVIRLPEIVVENSLLAADFNQMSPFGNHQLRGVTDQGVRKGSVDAALIVEICPRQISLHQKRRHLVDPIGLLEHRRQSLNASWQRSVETGDRRDTRERKFVYPVDSYMASPDDPRIEGPGVLQ